jgi:hypothetical protein
MTRALFEKNRRRPVEPSTLARVIPPEAVQQQEPEWTESTKWTESAEVYGVPKARSE